MTGRACPSCAAPMQRRTLARKPQGAVELDLCFACQAIWFDQHESAQLTPGAVIDLFRVINEHRNDARRPLAANARCPVCGQALQLTHDVQRTNALAYYRCQRGHGRLTSFFQFLREKNFVRSLTRGEVEQLRAHVAQVRCSSCGAPVDLARDMQCGYCRAPIAILDAGAVRRTLDELDEAERGRRRIDPAAAIDALLAGKRFERELARIEGPSRHPGGMDLVSEALGLLMSRA